MPKKNLQNKSLFQFNVINSKYYKHWEQQLINQKRHFYATSGVTMHRNFFYPWKHTKKVGYLFDKNIEKCSALPENSKSARFIWVFGVLYT